MKMSRKPIAFIATDNSEKARAFYAEILGLKLLESSAFALVFADGAQVLRVQIVAELIPAPYTAHGWQVSNIETEVARLKQKNVDTLRFESLAQDDAGIWTSPDGHKIAWFNDPSKNVLSFTQFAAK